MLKKTYRCTEYVVYIVYCILYPSNTRMPPQPPPLHSPPPTPTACIYIYHIIKVIWKVLSIEKSCYQLRAIHFVVEPKRIRILCLAFAATRLFSCFIAIWYVRVHTIWGHLSFKCTNSTHTSSVQISWMKRGGGLFLNILKV